LLGPRGNSSDDVNDPERIFSKEESRVQPPRSHHEDGTISTGTSMGNDKPVADDEIILARSGESNQSCTSHLESVVSVD